MIPQHGIRGTLKTTLKWRERWRNEYCKNWQSPQPFGDVAGQPKPTCYTAGISHCINADDSHKIHFRYWWDRQSILDTLSTWCSGYIEIFEKITFATSSVCEEPPWRNNSSIECAPNQTNQPSFSRKWWEYCTWKNFGHGKLAWLEWPLP